MMGTSACFNKNDEFGETIMTKIKPSLAKLEPFHAIRASKSFARPISRKLVKNYDKTEQL
jgi:hypothetical protein